MVCGLQRADMQQPTSNFEILNPPADFEQPECPTEYFSLTAKPNTRLSRRTLMEDDITAPMMLQRLRHPFVLCEVTVSGDFVNDWDQAGLVIFTGGHPAHNQSFGTMRFASRGRLVVFDPQLNRPSSKWARVALEQTDGELGISTLVANPKCGVDWASTPAFPLVHPDHVSEMPMPSLRLKLERVGSDLWVWFMNPEMYSQIGSEPSPEFVRRQWRKCREIVNFFDNETAKGDTWVGCYASRPVEEESDEVYDGLFVEFEDLEIL